MCDNPILNISVLLGNAENVEREQSFQMDVNVLYGINVVADMIPQKDAVLKSNSVIGNSYQDVEPIYSEPDQILKKSVYITN